MTQRDSDHRPSQFRRLSACAGVSAALLLAAPSAAQAADYEVTNTGDAPGSGQCTSGGECSLRQAITSANFFVADPDDRLLFHSSLSGSTITLESPLPPIDDFNAGELEIIGPGAPTLAVSGDDSHRIFEIEGTSGPVTISGLTLRDGFVASPEAGGAIHNEGELTLRNSIVTGNEAAFGGGIRTSGATTIEGSTISDNRSGSLGGGVRAVSGATLTVRRSTISGNRSGSFGGGVQADLTPLTIEASTVTANESSNVGGGVHSASFTDPTLTSTIVAGNTASSAAPDLWSGSNAEFQSSFSLIGDTSDADINDLGGSILNQGAQLGPLAANGGPTPTHAPALTSPAIDAGLAAGPDQRGFPRPVNQPTIPLAPGSNAADIGAVELAAVPPAAVPVAVPSNAFSFGKLKRKKRKGIAILFVNVPGPGEIGLRGKGIKNIGLSGATARASRAVSGGRVKLRIKAAKKGKAARKLRKRLRTKGKAKRRVRVTYVPTGGAPNTQSRKVKLAKKRKRR